MYARLDSAPDKIEWVDGIFTSERERLVVLGMLIENLGIDRVVQFGDVQDWKDAIAAREVAVSSRRGFPPQPPE